MKKAIVLFSTMIVLAASFSNCKTVKAGIFRGNVSPDGCYMISPNCTYNDITDNPYIDSVYTVIVSTGNDGAALIINDAISGDTEAYELSKGSDYDYYTIDPDAGYVGIEYSDECESWFLRLDGTYTCLDIITWEYSYMPVFGNSDTDWMNPFGTYYLYEDTFYENSLFRISDLYRSGYFCVTYTNDYGIQKELLDLNYADDEISFYLSGLGEVIMDDCLCELYTDDGTVYLLNRVIPYDYENMDVYSNVYFDVPYDNGTVRIGFDHVIDEFGQLLKYTMTSEEFFNEPITGYAIVTLDADMIISNDFMISLSEDFKQIGIPYISPNFAMYEWDIDEDKIQY